MQDEALCSLFSPALVVDLDKVKRNVQKMSEHYEKMGVQLRPHMKTHKTLECAEIMTGGTRRCIVVSTLAEASFYADHGFDDILYAYPLPFDKVERCAALSERLDLFQVLLDHPDALEQLERRPLKDGRRWHVWMKLDCGNGRAGVLHSEPGALKLALAIARTGGVELAGVYAHCGNTYKCTEQTMDLLPDFSIETWTLIVLVFTLITVYGYAPYGFFKNLGIHGPKPWPFIGTFLNYRKGVHHFDQECYKKYGKVWSLFDGRQPLMCIMDTLMIKTILIKECYSNFTNRRDLGLNGPLRDAVSITEDEQWKRIRSILSPSFTSGRLKEMYTIMLQHSQNLINLLQKKVKADDVIDVKDVFGPYSMDVVTSTAFSVDIDSINHPSDPFVANIKKMVKFNFMNPLLILVVLFPFTQTIFDKMDVSLFPGHVLDFFYNFLRQIKSDRSKEKKKSRVDFMQLMVNAHMTEDNEKDSSLKGLTDKEILAQAMIFIFAGYETTSSSLGFLAYSLATNPDIQKKLQEEIDKTFPGKVRPNYDDLMQLEYLDMVVNESMRLYPIANRLERMAKTSVEINGVTIPKGTVVAIPVYALHRDPALWPEPEAFKPERFSKENSANIDPYTYLPFGAGPRNCIGMRFALVVMKLAIAEILQHYSFVPCKETEIPMVLGSEGFVTPKTPIKLKLKPRTSS